jgi:anti-anti-sigma regulatory factor
VTAVHVRVDMNGTAVLSISGDIDRTVADHLHTAMQELFTVHHPTTVRVDIGHVTYLSQIGAAMIVAWRAAAAAAGTTVGFRNATDHIVRQAAAYGYRDLFE